MLEALAASLQIDVDRAWSVALYELHRCPENRFHEAHRYSDPKSSEKGHTGRDKRVTIKVTKAEKEAATAQAKAHGMSIKHFVRHVILLVRDQIRKGELEDLTNSSKATQQEIGKEWAKANPDHTSKNSSLKTAWENSYEDARYRNLDEIEERIEDNKNFMMEHPVLTRVYSCMGLIGDDDDYSAIDDLRSVLDPYGDAAADYEYWNVLCHDRNKFVDYWLSTSDWTMQEIEAQWEEDRRDVKISETLCDD